MKTLYEREAAAEIRRRFEELTPDAARIWGSMDPAQMMAHCTAFMEMAAGTNNPPRNFIGRLVGPIVKRSMLSEAPLRRGMPTDPTLLKNDSRDFTREKTHLLEALDRFVSAGPQGCTTHPHCFLGRMTPTEWAALSYKHLDHHLQQFGA